MNPFRLNCCSLLLSCALMALSGAPASAGSLEDANSIARGPDLENAQRSDTESANKSIVNELSRDMLSHVSIDALGRYFAQHLIEHDSLVKNGRQAMLDSILTMRQQRPALGLTVKHMLADRDLVFVHSQLSNTPANEMSGTNRFDMYRLDRGIIVEHWAVQASAPIRSASGNSVFSDLYQYPVSPGPIAQQRVEMNRLLVSNLSQEVFGKRNFALLDRMWSTGYIQHNQHVVNGRAALGKVIEYIAPVGSSYRVVRSMADGDLALVCSQNVDPGGNPANEFSGAAVCDLYRVVNFELVEHWDVRQEVPPTSVNGNSMFSNLYRASH